MATIPTTVPDTFPSEWTAAGEDAAAEATDPWGFIAALGFYGGYTVAKWLTGNNDPKVRERVQTRVHQSQPQIAKVFKGYAASLRSNGYVQGALYVKLRNEFSYLYQKHIPASHQVVLGQLETYVNGKVKTVRGELYATRGHLRELHHYAHSHIRNLGQVQLPDERKARRSGDKQTANTAQAHLEHRANQINQHMAQGFQRVWAQLSPTVIAVKRIETTQIPALRTRARKLEGETQHTIPARIKAAEAAATRLVAAAQATLTAEVQRAEARARLLVAHAEGQSLQEQQAAEQQARQLVATAEARATAGLQAAEAAATQALQYTEGELKVGIATAVSGAESAATEEIAPIAGGLAALGGIVASLVKTRQECTNPMCRDYHSLSSLIHELKV
ncbi:MAG: hypothetical protein ACRDX8_08825, partial [Acidimicrobiales bacterium]